MTAERERSSDRTGEAAAWYLERAGKTHGPFDRDQLSRGLEAGKLHREDLVCRVGETRWQALGDLEELQRPRLPPVGADGRSPARAWKKAALVATAAATVLAGLVAAGLLAWGLASRGAGTPVLPIDPHRLPPSTHTIMRAPIADPDATGVVSPAITASALGAAVCGGEDVASTLLQLAGAPLGQLQHAGVLDLVSNDRARHALQCGEAVRAMTPDTTATYIQFLDGEDARAVGLVPTQAVLTSALTGEFSRHSFSGLPGQCHTAPEGSTCRAGGPAFFFADEHLFFGALEAIESFARAYTSPRTELSTNVQILASLASGASRDSETTALRARPERVDWALPCRRAAPTGAIAHFMGACFPRGQDPILASIDARTRGLSIEARPVVTSGAVEVRYTLLARDADAAHQLERDVGDLARDWRSHVENREADLIRALRAPSESDRDRLWAALQDPFVRSLRSMRVERDGESVSLVMAEELREGEQQELREHLERDSDTRDAVVQVLDGLRQGTGVPESSLARIVGSEAASWMLLPRATQVDCDAFRQRLAELASGTLEPRLFGLRYQLDQRFSPGVCVGAAITPTLRDCVQAASDLEQLGACRFADSPFIAAARRRLLGQWEVREVTGFDFPTRRALQTSRMQITEDRIAFEITNAVHTSELLIASNSETRATVQVPLGDDAVALELTFDTVDQVSADTPREGRIVFHRTTFAADLPMESI